MLLLPAPCPAEWVPVGPPGGDVRSLAADPRNPRLVYLGTAEGALYRSDDGGERWRRLRPGFPLRGMSLDELIVDPRGRLRVGFWEVGGAGGGVATSGDGGNTFELLPGIADHPVRALAVAPADPDLLVAGTPTGVFRSRDGGQSWERISPVGHPELRNLNSIAVDPEDPDVIYAGTWHLPWKTTDGGHTWRSIHAGIIHDSDIMTLSFDRRRPGTLYATACTGIYRTTDAALRWSKLRGIPSSSRRTRAFAQDPAWPDSLYAGTTQGLWASDDGGVSWRLATQRELVVNAVLVLPGSVLLGAEGAGVLRSADGGQTFSVSNEGFSERFVSRLLLDTEKRRLLAAVRDERRGGVLVAPRPSGPWTRLGTGLEGREVLALALVGGEILAGTDDGLYLSSSERGIWRRLPTVVDGSEAHPRVVDVAALSARAFLAATPQGLLQGGEGGERWQRLRLGLGGAVTALAARTPSLALAATALGLFRSTDGGARWEQVSAGLADTTIRSLAFVPGGDQVLLATSSSGLLRSEDQGRRWQRCGGGLPLGDINGLVLHPDGQTVFASNFARGGIYRSDDAGETWQPFPTEGLVTPRVFTLGLDPGGPGSLLAAAAGGGLYEWRSSEGEVATGSRR